MLYPPSQPGEAVSASRVNGTPSAEERAGKPGLLSLPSRWATAGFGLETLVLNFLVLPRMEIRGFNKVISLESTEIYYYTKQT